MTNINTIVEKIAAQIASNSRFVVSYDAATGSARRFENVNAYTDKLETFPSFPEAVYSIVDLLEAENPEFNIADLVDVDDLVQMEIIFDHIEA